MSTQDTPTDHAAQSSSSIARLPSEIVQHILTFVSYHDLVACQLVSKNFNSLTVSCQTAWRIQCASEYRFWQSSHRFKLRLNEATLATDWHALFVTRKRTDASITATLTGIINRQNERLEKVSSIVRHGYDAKDLLLRELDISGNREDYLARTWWSQRVLDQIERHTAVQTWDAIRTGDTSINLERAMACIDLFLVPRPPETLDEVEEHFDLIAHTFEQEWFADPDTGEIPRNAISLLVTFLRRHKLIGVVCEDEAEFRRLRNNLLVLNMCEESTSSIFLTSAIIFCAVARRLGFQAHPINFPEQIHIVISPAVDASVNLDGKDIKLSDKNNPRDTSYFMYLDADIRNREVSYEELNTRAIMRSPYLSTAQREESMMACKSPTSLLVRAASNMTHSTEYARDSFSRVLTNWRSNPEIMPEFVLNAQQPAPPRVIGSRTLISLAVNIIAYMFVVRDDIEDRERAAITVAQEILSAVQKHEISLQLVRDYFVPTLENVEVRGMIVEFLNKISRDDEKPKPPKRRVDISNISRQTREHPTYRVGTYFEHKKYPYVGFVTGWDARCMQSEEWQVEMGVASLSKTNQQPFYHVVDNDNVSRYVAEENIRQLVRGRYSRLAGKILTKVVPSEAILRLAGEYMRRWDEESEMFVSNMRQEYPDD